MGRPETTLPTGNQGVSIMGHLAHLKKIVAGIGVVTALTAVTVMPALADDSLVSQTVTADGGQLTVDISTDPVFDAVAYSHAAHQTSAPMVISVDDSRGTGAGWQVSASISGINTPDGVTLDANSFEILNIAAPKLKTEDSGQDPATLATGTNGSIGSGRVLATADVNEGQGAYTQAMDLGIDLPAGAKAGAYTATLTVTNVVVVD
jgi:hypothetical protein